MPSENQPCIFGIVLPSLPKPRRKSKCFSPTSEEDVSYWHPSPSNIPTPLLRLVLSLGIYRLPSRDWFSRWVYTGAGSMVGVRSENEARVVRAAGADAIILKREVRVPLLVVR
eukprot:8940441-Pyramimonas_sp.AAC.2